MSPDYEAYLAGVRAGREAAQLVCLRALAAVVYAANPEHTVTVSPTVLMNLMQFTIDCQYLPDGGMRYTVTE